MVMLDFIRYQQHLKGTKIGCREGDCGACTVLVGELINDELQYQSVTSCLMPIGNAQGKHIVSIEGINFPGVLNPVQQAMAEEGGTQCGFCTPGFVVSMTGFCLGDQAATKENAIAAIDGNICRCTGYKPIERAAAKVAELLMGNKEEDRIAFVTRNKILPEYFAGIKQRLQTLQKEEVTQNRPGMANRLVGGGTDLYVQQQEEMTRADIHFTAQRSIPDPVMKAGNKCLIHASATVTDLKSSPVINEAFPAFHRYARLISSTPIRNMATIAGNFINASPIGDFTIFFLAADAQLVLTDGITKRELPLRKLYKGYKTLDKKPSEYIEQIWFELPGPADLFHFEKVSKRKHLDIASVNSAMQLTMEADHIASAAIAAGGVGPIPVYLQKTSEFLKGKQPGNGVIREAIEIMKTEISPISDARGTKEYKTLLLAQLIKAHFMELFPGMTVEPT